jgi:hypothetical protein
VRWLVVDGAVEEVPADTGALGALARLRYRNDRMSVYELPQ